MDYVCKKKEGFYPFYLKEIDGEYFLYNVITNGIFKLDREEYDIVTKNVDINEEKYADKKKIFEEKFIIITSKNREHLEAIYERVAKKKRRMNATGLTLMISQECNMRCKYCYGEGGEYSNRGMMKLDTALKAVDYLVSHTEEKLLNICFFGGEPLLNFELIKKVIAYTKELEKEGDRKFTYCMTTNATLFNEEIEIFIKKNKISITVSLDGNKETNDLNRFYANKKSAYNDAVTKIQNIKDHITVRATIAPPDLDIFKNITYIIQELDVRRVAWAEADNLLTDHDYDILFDKTLPLLNEMKKLIADGNYQEVRKYHTFIELLKKLNSDGLRSKGCGSGTNLIAVDIDGKIYPCHRFVGINDTVLGNVELDETAKTDFYSNASLTNFEYCRDCVARGICGGGCINENYYAGGNINTPSEKHCKYRRALFDKVLDIYITLTDDEKIQLLS